MKKLLLILLCVPLIGFGQEVKNSAELIVKDNLVYYKGGLFNGVNIYGEDAFLKHVNNTRFTLVKELKILCFFDAMCEFCMEAAKSLTDLSKEINNFPEIHIIFCDIEENRIPDFFIYAGKEYSHQVLPFYNEDDEINSYFEILGYDYAYTGIILYDANRPIYFFEGTDSNAFNIDIIENIIRKVNSDDKYKN